jgi:hypothetical protein
VASGTSLAVYDPAFGAFLTDTARNDPSELERFVARNFIIDDRLAVKRAESYLSSGVPDAVPTWARHHRAYEAQRLQTVPSRGRLPYPEEVVSAVDWPEPFRIVLSDDYSACSGDLRLIRVESLVRMAAAVDMEVNQLSDLLAAYLDPNATDRRDKLWLASVLDGFSRAQRLRGVFAGFVEDAREGFQQSLSTPDMLAYLRDRFGLLQYDPEPGEEIPLALFAYDVSEVPRIDGRSTSAILPPTALESGRSPAFLPAPAGSHFGSAVDLSGGNRSPAREVLHLAFRYRPEHTSCSLAVSPNP